MTLEVVIIRWCGEEESITKKVKKEMANAVKKCDRLYSLDGEKIFVTQLELLVKNHFFEEYTITYVTEYDKVHQKSYSKEEFYRL